MINQYWYVSWWAIFDYMDKQAHKIAKEYIWDCMTAWANIDFFKPIKQIEDFENKIFEPKSNIIKVITSINNNSAIASFTFIKLK